MRARGLPYGKLGAMQDDVNDRAGMPEAQTVVLLEPGNDLFAGG